MPEPLKGEKQQDYVSRFMGSAEAAKSFPDAKQRAAVAYSMYKQHQVARRLRAPSSAS
jgi:hypothetical protein